MIPGLSGGVDSSVVAMLVHRAIGDRLTCVFVDNGLLRLNEGQQVMDMFGDHFGLEHYQGRRRRAFSPPSRALTSRKPNARPSAASSSKCSTTSPRSSRTPTWLAQGTIYPDVIESAASKTGKAHVIKSHHNVGGLPSEEEMKMGSKVQGRPTTRSARRSRAVQWADWEARRVGLELGLKPYDMLYRHPLPGPGLGVRVLGGEEKRVLATVLLRKADAIFIKGRAAQGRFLYNQVVSSPGVRRRCFLPVRAPLASWGDGRKYDLPGLIALVLRRRDH